MLQKYNHEPENEIFWHVLGMLHNIDFEQFLEVHCMKGVELLRDAQVDEAVIRSAMGHG